uniref:Uncharacterized protein n=1 Tax=Arundo donax TaxID=35708 RepID=A0A0A8ZYR2_ARUDO
MSVYFLAFPWPWCLAKYLYLCGSLKRFKHLHKRCLLWRRKFYEGTCSHVSINFP